MYNWSHALLLLDDDKVVVKYEFLGVRDHRSKGSFVEPISWRRG